MKSLHFSVVDLSFVIDLSATSAVMSGERHHIWLPLQMSKRTIGKRNYGIMLIAVLRFRIHLVSILPSVRKVWAIYENVIF